MVNSYAEYKMFLEENYNDDLFIYIVFSDNKQHSCVSNVSIIFVQNFKTGKLYHFVVDHQDSLYDVKLDEFIKDISKFNGKFFSLDKKSLIQHIPIKFVLDINLGLYLKSEKLINIVEFETNAHKFINQTYYKYPFLNKVIPLMKHREMVSNIFTQIKGVVNNSIFREKYFLKTNSLIIETLSELERNGIFVDKSKFSKRFGSEVYNGYVYSQYNFYTATGRPSNRYGGVNYAALNKDDGARECFVSRSGEEGTMVLIDYSAFHPRIICELTNFNLPIDVDFYKYIAKLCFNKDEIDQQDISDAKTFTFKQLYGGVEEKYSHIQFFHNLKGFIDRHWKQFKDNGYTITPFFGRKITSLQVKDPNPCKLFNYILQATETEIAVPILKKVNEFLRDKQSKCVLYTYDSILFDVCNDELDIIKTDVVNIMKDGNRFPVKFFVGKSYADLNQISI